MNGRANACCKECKACFIAVNPSRPPKYCANCRRDKDNEARRVRYSQRDRRVRTTGKTMPSWDDDVKALCWCGETFVGVPLDLVRACQTRSCGLPECGPELLRKPGK